MTTSLGACAALLMGAGIFGLGASASTIVRTSTTYAGTGVRGNIDGELPTASFSDPSGLAFAADTKTLYVADTFNNEVRAVTADGVRTVAGNGAMGRDDATGSAARFSNPYGVAYDSKNGKVYVADTLANRIREISADGAVRTIAGNGQGSQDGQGTSALFLHPASITYDVRDDNLYVVDENNRVRRVSTDGTVTTIAGSTKGFADGPGTDAKFWLPSGITSNPKTGELYVSDFGNARIRKVTLSGDVTTVAGDGKRGWSDGPAATAEFRFPAGVAYDSRDDSLYVVDRGSELNIGNPAGGGVREISLASATVTTVAGGDRRGYAEGTGPAAQFSQALGIAVDPSDGTVFVADTNNNRIRRLTVAP